MTLFINCSQYKKALQSLFHIKKYLYLQNATPRRFTRSITFSHYNYYGYITVLHEAKYMRLQKPTVNCFAHMTLIPVPRVTAESSNLSLSHYMNSFPYQGPSIQITIRSSPTYITTLVMHLPYNLAMLKGLASEAGPGRHN